MKVLIIGLGFVLGAMGVLMAYVSAGHVNEKVRDAQHLEAEILDLEQKISLLKGLPQRPVLSLDAAYVIFMNDMDLIARAHRVVFMASLQGASDADIGKNTHPSVFSGLREVRFHGVFAGLTRKATLLSLFDALAAFEKETPVLFQSIGYEKDALMFDLTIVGL